MRVLLLGPIYSNANHGAERGVFDALVNLGHSVCVYVYRKQIYDDILLEQPVEMIIEHFNPTETFDVILAMGPGVPPSFVNKFESLKGYKVLINSEPIRLSEYRSKIDSQKHLFNQIFSFDESELSLYKELDINSKFLACGYNPEWYKPLANKERQPLHDIGFAGSIGGKWINRVHLLERIQKTFGNRLRILQKFDAVEVNKFYNQCKVVINLGLHCPLFVSDVTSFKAFGLQQRIFEVIGAGKVVITNEIPTDTNQLFKHDETILYYNKENLEEIINYALNDSVRAHIENNVLRIREKHTYKERMQQMLEMIS